MTIVDIKNHLQDEPVLAVIALSQYRPTAEKLKSLADQYASDPSIVAFACMDYEFVCGTILLKCTAAGAYEITGIATEPGRRKQGVASRLIAHTASSLECRVITAETDDDAVDFYRKYGFKIQSLGEKYPGTVRYLCTLKLN